jgi:hypothetical protein
MTHDLHVIIAYLRFIQVESREDTPDLCFCQMFHVLSNNEKCKSSGRKLECSDFSTH